MKTFRGRMKNGAVVAVLLVGALLSGCGSGNSPKVLTSAQLVDKLLPAPDGYTPDTTKGSYGQITPQVFAGYGGVKAIEDAGFVTGLKVNYINSNTEEGIAVTLLEFTTAAKASAYFQQTAHQTLSFAGATYASYPQLTGAVEASGTKTYGGNYVHAVVDSYGQFYFQIVYADALTDAVPTELQVWVRTQWALAHPGITYHPPSTTTPGG